MTDYAAAIQSVLDDFKIDGKVDGQTCGPSVTRYEISLGEGVRVEKIARLQKNIAYATASESVRILAPIPGKSAVGIELPREDREIVALRDIMPTDNHPLAIGIGKGVQGETITGNLAKMPHLLVAGTTGSGKSSFINSMLVTLLDQDPEKVKLVLIDPKMVELTPYNGAAHLMRPVITEVEDAVEALQELVDEMEQRYQSMRTARVRNVDDLTGYPYIVVVVDELADLMMQARDRVEPLIVRLLQKARAAGIHLVMATQRPSVDVVTGLIKANAPSRLAFATSSATDSRVVLDGNGGEELLGYGDGLFKPVGEREPIRIQGALVTDAEIYAAVKRATAVADVERMVDEISGTPPQGPNVLDILNDLIKRAKDECTENEKYITELLDMPKRTRWGGTGGRMDKLTKAPERIADASTLLQVMAETLEQIRDTALQEV